MKHDHGLYSKKIFLIRIEKSEDFLRTLQMFQDEWQPAGPTEAALVRTLALESINLDRFRMLQAEALNAMSDRVSLDSFYDDATGGPVTPEQLSGAERQYAGLENYTLEGHLPNLALIDRMIGRADRTFRASLAALLNLRKASPAPPPPPVAPSAPKPTPPGEPSESLERRIAEFRAREEAAEAAARKNEQTNPATAQLKSNQPLPTPAQPGNRARAALPHPVSTHRGPGRKDKC